MVSRGRSPEIASHARTAGAREARPTATANGWSAVRGWTDVAVPGALYGLAALLLAVPGLGLPRFAYNWESYTAWRVFGGGTGTDRPGGAGLFALTDGLMTDSGQGPLVGLPVRLGFALGGVGVTALRLPVALLAATAVPLLWLVGRRLVGPAAAGLAATFLALSPVFLLYGRTATLVGISVAPALLTVLALIEVLRAAGGWRWVAWLAALQALLVAGAYAYAPIRFLWPIAIGLIAIELAGGYGRRRRLLLALVVTGAALPAALVGISAATAADPDRGPVAVVGDYYRGRGEQVLALRERPEEFGYYLRPTPAERGSGVRGAPDRLVRRLIGQNAGDLARLLLDRGTRPTVTDFWNPQGRFVPGLLVPFAAIGLARTGWPALTRWRGGAGVAPRVLLGLLGGFTLPLLLTSRVHAGRLIFALPPLLLLAAVGAIAAGGWLGERLARRGGSPAAPRLIPLAVAVLLVAAVGRGAWVEARLGVPPTREARVAAALVAWAPAAARHGGVALVAGDAAGAEVEAVAVAAVRLDLDARYRFADLSRGAPSPLDPDDPRPPLYYGGLLDRLAPSSLPVPDPCGLLYLVLPEAEARFLTGTGGGALPGCAAPVRYEVLGF